MKSQLAGLATLLLVPATAVVWLGGCNRVGRSEAIVYVCTETYETLSAPPQSVPAINSKTGRRTLYRGVYCVECKRWYPAPPSEHRNGNPKPLRCRIHKIEMTFAGPAGVPPAESATVP
jgi:hypothetical protein